MSRPPIDQQQPSACRQAIWEQIRAQAPAFTINDILLFVGLDASSVKEYLTGLVNAGFLERGTDILSKPSQSTTYILIKDNGVEAPRVRKDGTIVTMGQGRRQMWNAMQVLRDFSPTDLVFKASTETHAVAEGEAKTYCAILCAAGYLVGRGNQRYSLLAGKWTGPHPPQVQRTKQVYDPNLKKVVWSRIVGGAE